MSAAGHRRARYRMRLEGTDSLSPEKLRERARFLEHVMAAYEEAIADLGDTPEGRRIVALISHHYARLPNHRPRPTASTKHPPLPEDEP